MRNGGAAFIVHHSASITSRLRGRDSNPRPPGYEPDELPLLYPATTTKERMRIGPLQ
jgi:hypothetical protein